MHITWLSWKDIDHPEAGGAERVSDEIRKRLVADGHEVTLITASYEGAQPEEIIAGVQIYRSGSRYTVYLSARKIFKSLEGQDIVIDEMNTVPFFAGFYAKSAKRVLLTYQLARRVWFYQMVFPLSLIGFCLEPLYLRLISRRYQHVLTESESTKMDLGRYGFSKKDISVFRVGMDSKRPASLAKKNVSNTVIFLGALRPMKRPIDAIKAFEAARDSRGSLKMVIAGSTSGPYAQKVIKYAENSRHAEAIDIKGRVSEKEKGSLLQGSDVILVTSIKEGWGLIVTEANSQGTPAIVYDTDGLRDSVVADETGLIVPSGDTEAMGAAIIKFLDQPALVSRLRQNAYKHSEQFTYDQSYQDFTNILRSRQLLE